ncbi:TIGR01777 family oxidoreductase [Pilimelia columellifera]|uniref:TIGR01777 family oxidoreductase n=1 Tax=Pilimelia columellifera subsp. columellifera TaxID=706583 RepID=A0ABN3NRD9_9ACTN
MRIVLAGASGFLGTALADRLRAQGHDLTRLVRRTPRGPEEARWDPSSRALDPAVLAGADAVVNLAGAGVGDHRWTDAYKRTLRDSRVHSAATLATTTAALPADARPGVFLAGSAIGFYGDTGDTPVDESSPAGEGFLADICREWEAAAAPVAGVGVRLCLLRTGLPLHRDGGLLKPQLLPFRLGLGGRFGSGRQWVPWISLRDWLAAAMFLLECPDLAGPVNLVSPRPVTNAEFTKALAAQLGRPAIWAIPGVALRIALGEFAVETLRSARVQPQALDEAGFRFEHPDLASAMRAAFDDDRPPR